MTLEQSRQLCVESLTKRPKLFIESSLKIIAEGELVDFTLNRPQKIVFRAIQEQEAQKKPIRIIVLKARREGISTLIEALIYHKISTRSHRTAMVIAHELDSSKEIFEMTRRFYVNCRLPSFRPMIRSMGVRNLIFDNVDTNSSVKGLDSKLIVETAMDIQAGRSMEIDYLHISELGFFRNAEELMTGLLQCVNDKNPDTMIVMESTANGVGGYFYDYVQAAINGENDYKLVFLPWFIDPRYQMPLEPDFKATSEEEKLRKLYEWEGNKVVLTDEQLYWRRKKIANSFNGDAVQFKQEYPGSVDEAFIYSGRTRFNQDALTSCQQRARKPVFRGFLHEEKTLSERKHTLESNDRGYLTIYEQPVKGASYVLFFDVSEGKDVTSRESDYSSGDVIRCETMEQVAHWHGRIAPELLDREIEALGHYYNEAYVGVEKNNMGYGVVAALKDSYPRLFINIVHDRNGKEITREFGWRTTSKTKPLMINGLAEVINTGDIQINHPGTIEECRRFTIHEDGSLGAPDGQHDDRVISLAGAVQMYLHSYNEPAPSDEAQDDDEDDE